MITHVLCDRHVLCIRELIAIILNDKRPVSEKTETLRGPQQQRVQDLWHACATSRTGDHAYLTGGQQRVAAHEGVCEAEEIEFDSRQLRIRTKHTLASLHVPGSRAQCVRKAAQAQ
jgi:hypothetical protein